MVVLCRASQPTHPRHLLCALLDTWTAKHLSLAAQVVKEHAKVAEQLEAELAALHGATAVDEAEKRRAVLVRAENADHNCSSNELTEKYNDKTVLKLQEEIKRLETTVQQTAAQLKEAQSSKFGDALDLQVRPPIQPNSPCHAAPRRAALRHTTP